MGEGENFHLRRQEGVDRFDFEGAVLPHRDEPQAGAGAFGEQLPRHEVAVVFEFGEQNDIALEQKPSAPGLRHEIDCLGRPAGEDDFSKPPPR